MKPKKKKNGDVYVGHFYGINGVSAQATSLDELKEKLIRAMVVLTRFSLHGVTKGYDAQDNYKMIDLT